MYPGGPPSDDGLGAEVGSEPLRLAVGVAWTPQDLAGPVHVMDGDGASLCGEVSAGNLVLIPSRTWDDVETVRRCGPCRFLIALPWD
jgi:hypothetical protein